ncbi:hypothetical protein QE374_001335 [Microbacterium sp. SORGH_AS428]|uniref:DUF4190 domain-containing protein n=1 Tax=Microbacterium sp. SORGH_AS_0428 TaxID=3041788 RepID=UPI0028639C76|nr:DUF4190 domain-containing protein [Microbacterium sp. SORGH_AS_0428]MDR6199426.1 hypothetical protein [Microbacterium sp. SORGH_AS_0428]
MSQPPQQYVYVTRPTDGLAITSFVLALLGFNLLAVIFGHVALSRIRRSNAAGAGFAVAGLVIGYLTLAAIAVLILAAFGIGIWAVNAS